MIEEQGQITNIKDGKLAIKVTSPGSCESCAIHGSCYSGGRVVWVPASEQFQVNDYVRFSIANTSVLKISTLVYGAPLIGVLAGILLGYLWLFRAFASDPKTLLSVGLGAVLFAAAGFGVSRRERAIRNQLKYTVVRVDPPANADGESPQPGPDRS